MLADKPSFWFGGETMDSRRWNNRVTLQVPIRNMINRGLPHTVHTFTIFCRYLEGLGRHWWFIIYIYDLPLKNPINIYKHLQHKHPVIFQPKFQDQMDSSALWIPTSCICDLAWSAARVTPSTCAHLKDSNGGDQGPHLVNRLGKHRKNMWQSGWWNSSMISCGVFFWLGGSPHLGTGYWLRLEPIDFRNLDKPRNRGPTHQGWKSCAVSTRLFLVNFDDVGASTWFNTNVCFLLKSAYSPYIHHHILTIYNYV